MASRKGPRRSPRTKGAEDAPDPRSLRALVPRHLEWMRVQNYSSFTITSRDYGLRSFIAWCEERAVIQAVDVTPAVLEEYKRHLFHQRKQDGRPLRRSTQTRALVNVLGLMKWLAKRGLILTNPGALLELPRVEKNLPHTALTPAEVEQVLGAIDVTQPLGLRDRAILEMAYSTGMRRSELRSVKLGDVDAERGTVVVRQGKGKKDRVVPIGERALAWLNKYLEEVRPFFATDPDDGEIFLTRQGRVLNVATLTVMGKRCRDHAGVAKPGSMHIYRHSAATGMLEGGADIRVIQEFLGHANLTSTQVYTKVAIQTLKAVHARTHPAEQPRRGAGESDPDSRGGSTK